ncbi:unnamed protein product [Adineta ricciae]|uniref:Uncharacterized protein n=1 Tax=Adineta ricciae TaxID=249248 RepID=A0A815JY59_ADIRI|nr:unnamed protein product [Adineta ricciae]CAF1383927.1 unnamed protein product [Adineta ricciae]
MRIQNCLLFFCYLLYLSDCGAFPSTQVSEQTLIANLLTGYNNNIRPDTQVYVDITASIQQIVSIDEKQQIMTSSSFISQSWLDTRLTWTPSANGNITVVMIPAQKLWLPDTMILNSADSSGYLSINTYSLASVDYTGDVYMILPALASKTRCSLFIQKFPFDNQICSINLTSWSQGANRLVYTENASTLIDISNYIEHPLWKLKSVSMDVIRTSDRSLFEDTYNDVISIQLFLQRKPLYYIMNGIFTCLILNCVTLLAFALPFGSQIGLCMTCFMTYSVNSLTFANIFPQQSQYLMMITLYFILSMCWTLISMLWFIVCNHFISKAQLPKLLFDFSGLLQRRSANCFSKSKEIDLNDKKEVSQMGDGELKDSNDAEKMNKTPNRCVSCRKLFSVCLRKRVKVENIDKAQEKSGNDGKSTKNDITPDEIGKSDDVKVNKEKADPKCNFCDRCEPCQEDFDKDKGKGKNKKDIEGKCSILNYLAFAFVLLCVFVSNVVVWVTMAS